MLSAAEVPVKYLIVNNEQFQLHISVIIKNIEDLKGGGKAGGGKARGGKAGGGKARGGKAGGGKAGGGKAGGGKARGGKARGGKAVGQPVVLEGEGRRWLLTEQLYRWFPINGHPIISADFF